jgi:SAM-dependent methyltransferase
LNILDLFKLKAETVMLDVGCGDGTLLRQCLKGGFNTEKGKLIGILPSKEEIARVLEDLDTSEFSINFELGFSSHLNLNSHSVDILICTSVLHLAGMTEVKVRDSLLEFNRVLRVSETSFGAKGKTKGPIQETGSPKSRITGSGILFIGEMPDRDELQGKDYGDSILRWLAYVFANEGLWKFILKSCEVVLAKLGSKNFIIAPKFMFFQSPTTFIQTLNEFGFEVIYYWKFQEKSKYSGEMVESQTRWNYLARKIENRVD